MDTESKLKENYIECMFWADAEELEGKGKEDLSQEAEDRINIDVHVFALEYGEKLRALETPGDIIAYAGHDLWLTRNRHGAGFWDRPEMYGEEMAKEMTAFSHGMGELHLIVGDDKKLYLE
jgi:hypothetical protein